MFMSKGLIIVTTPGFVPPKQYLELCYKHFPSYGATTFVVDDGTPELISAGGDQLPDIDTYIKGLEDDKAASMTLYFANITGGPLSEESGQPFVILRDPENNQPVLVAFMEGEYFPKKKDDKSPHSDEYHIGETLGAYLRKLYKMHNNDIQALETELKDEDMITYINGLCANRGIVVMHSVLGTVFKFESGNDNLRGEFPWGYVSNLLDFEEKSSKDVVTKADEPPKRGNMFGKAKAVIAQVADSVGIHQKKDTNTAAANVTAAAKTDTSVEAPRPKIAPPADLLKKGKRHAEQWYKDWWHGWDANGGKPPAGYKEGVEVEANDAYIAKNAKKFQNLAEAKERMLAQTGKPDLTYRGFSPIISPKQRSILTELLDSGAVKAKTETGKLLDPADLKGSPDVEPASKQIGKTFNDTLRWDREIKKRVIDACLGSVQAEEKVMPIILFWEEAQMIAMGTMTGDAPSEINTEEANDKTDDDLKPSASAPVVPAVKQSGKGNMFGRKQQTVAA